MKKPGEEAADRKPSSLASDIAILPLVSSMFVLGQQETIPGWLVSTHFGMLSKPTIERFYCLHLASSHFKRPRR
jgi:quinol-cytochrome oxidoreductase complex cytochrome b subunit